MPFSLLAHQSTLLPLATAGLLGAGMARLSYIIMDVLDDNSGEERTDQRIRLLDRIMRLRAKPRIVVVEAADADHDGGLYRPEDWRSERVADYASRTCQAACLTADCQACVGEEPDEGRVAFVTERRFKAPRPVRASAAAPLTKDGALRRRATPAASPTVAIDAMGLCYICCDRPMDSVLLPCGHSGACYSCAIENVARTELCPCCRGAVDQVVVYDPTSRRDEDGNAVFSVVGPGPVDVEEKSSLDALYEYVGWTAAT